MTTWDPNQYLKFADHRLRPALDLLARIGAEEPGAVYDLGCGAGNVTKLANQIMVACNIAAMGEALVLASKAGLDPEVVFNAVKSGLAGSTVLNAKAPMVISRNFKPGFRGQQPPETGPNNRVIIDDQNFHGSTPCDERRAASCWAEHGNTTAAAKPLPALRTCRHLTTCLRKAPPKGRRSSLPLATAAPMTATT